MIDDGKEIPEELRKLENVEGISIGEGLDFCGSSKALLKFLNTFYRSIDLKAKEIRDAYDKDDLVNYTIKVHALKSTARIIGAGKLAELALSLEEAGENQDKQYIREKTDSLLELFLSYKDRLSVITEIAEEKLRKEISPDDLADAYNALKEYIPAMDYDAVEVILDSLKEYNLPDDDQEIVTKLKELLEQMKWEEMNDITEKL